MNKKELYEMLKEKLKVTEEDFEKVYQECYEMMKAKKTPAGAQAIPDDRLEKYATARAHARYKKQLSSPAKHFVGYVIGYSSAKDWAEQPRIEALKKYKDDPESAVAEGYVNADGEPLYREHDWNRGQKIPEHDWSRAAILLAKQEDDDDYKKTTMTLRGDLAHGALPIMQLVDFRANVSKHTTDEMYVLNSSKVTAFDLVKDTELVDAKKMISHYFKDSCVSIGDLPQYHTVNEEDRTRFCFVIGNVVRINIADAAGKSNLIEITDESLSFDEDIQSSVACWLSQDIPIDFSDDAMDVILCGRTTLNQDQEISLQGYSVFCPEIWKVEKDAKPVGPEPDEKKDQDKLQKFGLQDPVKKEEKPQESDSPWG